MGNIERMDWWLWPSISGIRKLYYSITCSYRLSEIINYWMGKMMVLLQQKTETWMGITKGEFLLRTNFCFSLNNNIKIEYSVHIKFLKKSWSLQKKSKQGTRQQSRYSILNRNGFKRRVNQTMTTHDEEWIP